MNDKLAQVYEVVPKHWLGLGVLRTMPENLFYGSAHHRLPVIIRGYWSSFVIVSIVLLPLLHSQ